ncbi:MAG: hypothetical protein ACP5NX_00020 [Candidatus Bilamarchaeaceae archaeon]
MQYVPRVELKDVTRHTGFSKAEIPLIEKAMSLQPLITTPNMFIGGFAIRFYIDSKYTGKMKSGRDITDLDLVATALPFSLRNALEREPIVRGKAVYGEDGLQVRKSGSKLMGYNYHLKEGLKGTHQLMDDVCFFEGSICRIRTTIEDIEMASRIIISTNGVEAILRIADEGFLLAATIGPDALSPKRLDRAVCLLETEALEPGKIVKIAERFSNVMGMSEISKEEIMGTTVKQLRTVGNRRESVKEFLAELERKLR